MNIPVEFKLCKEEFLDFADLEQCLFQATMEAAQEVFRTILEALDQQLHRERDRKVYRDKGKRKTCLKTRFGVVEYERRVYEVTKADGLRQHVYLLDEVLGKETIGFVSMTVCRLAVDAVIEGTYRSAASLVSEMTGLSISPQAVWNVTQKLGLLQAEEIERQSELAKKEQSQGTLETEILYEEQDGIWLSLQGQDRQERGPRAEMKLAIAYDGALWSTGKKRRTLDNKVAYAGFETAKEFEQHKEGVVANHYDVAGIELRVLNGDGAQWIKTAKDPRGIYMLDPFHRNKAILEAVNDPDLRKVMFELLYSKKIEELLQCIEASIESTLDPAEQEKRRDLLKYFTNNRDGLLNYYRRGVEIPETRAPEIHHARMGSMESNIFTILGNRMKGRRACWSIAGGGNLARLLCLKYTTGYGNLFSRARTGEERKIQEEYREPLSASKVKETCGKGYESAFGRMVSNTGWIRKVFAPRKISELSFI